MEQLIVEWRKTMITAPSVGRETLDELEKHLRENVDQLVRSGMAEPEAFQRAVTQQGLKPRQMIAEGKASPRATPWVNETK